MTEFAVRTRTSPLIASSPALIWAYPGYCALAILLGGGGVAYGFANLAVQLGALAMLAAFPAQVGHFIRFVPRPLLALVGLTLALPLLQLVPLPDPLWRALPRRELVEASLAAAGIAADGWRPLTLDAGRTLVALLGLLAPLAVLALGFAAPRDVLLRAAAAVIAAGLVNVVLGVPQVVNGALVPYPENTMPGVLFGTFANRNSTALFLVCCLCLLTGLPTRRGAPLDRFWQACAAVLLVLAVFVTGSRTGIVLLALPAVLAALRVSASRGHPTLTPRRLLAGIAAAAALAAVVAMLAGPGSRVATALERFEQTGDPRGEIWQDARYAAAQYWPAGAGMGTFDEVFQLDESLEFLSERTAGRAHNDYLELAIEAGPFGLLLVAGWAAFVIAGAWQARRRESPWPAWAGAAVLLAAGLQSITDYPLRNQAMLCVGALAIALLVRSGAAGRAQP